MTAHDFDLAAATATVREIFDSARYMNALGVELVRVGEGLCETRLVLREEHQQQDGFVHAAVTAAMADHTAGGAAASLVPPGHRVLSSEYSIHLLRPARGKEARCVGKVLRPGRRLTIVEAEVLVDDVLVAKLTSTLVVVAAEDLKR